MSVTAHTAGDLTGQDARNEVLFFDNLDGFLAGRPLLNEVSQSDVL